MIFISFVCTFLNLNFAFHCTIAYILKQQFTVWAVVDLTTVAGGMQCQSSCN